MLFYRNKYIKIAARSAEVACFSLASQPHPGTCCHTGGDFKLNRLVDFRFAGAATSRAWFQDDATSPLTLRTGGADSKKTAGLGHLTPTVTATASCQRCSGGRTYAMTSLADFHFFYCDIGGLYRCGVFQRN